MRKLLYLVLCVSVLAALGCAITNYPVIEDDRGGYSGVIRTGHKAYIRPSGMVGTIYSDGSDMLFSLVYQNQYADRKIYTFNNFDPTASVIFLDDTYCDWRYEVCEITRAWDPRQDNLDDIFDYEFFPDCSGARSLSVLVSYNIRIGECGDARLWADTQNLAAEFAQLATTSFRGEAAYVFALNAANTTLTLSTDTVTANMPLYGQLTGFITANLDMVLPMTPNMRHEMNWLRQFALQNGDTVGLAINYGSLSGSLDLRIATDGLNHNLNRF
jgi:hypothetical protein